MAVMSIQVEVQPFEIPNHVNAKLPDGQWISVALKSLSDEQLTQMIEEFTLHVFEKAERNL